MEGRKGRLGVRFGGGRIPEYHACNGCDTTSDMARDARGREEIKRMGNNAQCRRMAALWRVMFSLLAIRNLFEHVFYGLPAGDSILLVVEPL